MFHISVRIGRGPTWGKMLRLRAAGWDWSIQAQIEAWSWDWSLQAQIEAWSLRLRPGGSAWGLVAEIEASRLRFKPGGSDWSLEAISGHGLGQPRFSKMTRGASGARNWRFHKENVSYFSKDWKGLQIREKAPPRLESKDDLLEARINRRPQRIERKCYPKAQIGKLLLTKSAACAQKWTGDDWESSRRHAIITVRCKYASKKISQNGNVEKSEWLFLSISVPPQRNQRKKCARQLFEKDKDIIYKE